MQNLHTDAHNTQRPDKECEEVSPGTWHPVKEVDKDSGKGRQKNDMTPGNGKGILIHWLKTKRRLLE